MKITDFKKGDSIVRVEPAKSLGPMMGLMGDVIERTGDRSYVGDKLEFIGIANGMIYCNREEGSFGHNVLGKDLSLGLDIFSDGWEYYKEIEDIESGSINSVRITLKEEVQLMVDNEDYESLNELKEIFNKITG